MGALEEIKGEFAGENKAKFIEGLSSLLKENGLEVMNGDQISALHSDYTKKNVDKTREFFGKQGLEFKKKENGEEEKWFDQYQIQIQDGKTTADAHIKTISDLQEKLKDVSTGDTDQLKVLAQELKEHKDLLKTAQADKEKIASEYEGKAETQRREDLLSNSTADFKYLSGLSNDIIESAKQSAKFMVSNMKTEFRNGEMVFLGEDNDALRDDKGVYRTVSSMMKKSMAHVLDVKQTTNGLGTDGSSSTSTGGDPNIYIFDRSKINSKMDLIVDMQKHGGAKGVLWSSQQDHYRELSAEHKLQ